MPDLSLDVDFKDNIFSVILPKKDFEFILSRRNNIIIFNLSFVLLPTEVYFISEKESYKKNTLIAYNIGHDKIILILSIKLVALYI